MSHGGAKPGAHHHKEAAISDLAHTDTDAIHDNVAGEINAITAKTTPASGDLVLIEDSAASNAKKKVQYTNLPSGGVGDLAEVQSDHDDGHNTVGSNWSGSSDTEEWNYALTVTAGDIILVEWAWAWDGMATTNDPEVKVVLDDGSTEWPSGNFGAAYTNADEGLMFARWIWIVESSSIARFWAWGNGQDIATVGQGVSGIDSNVLGLANANGAAGLNTTTDYTGSVTLRGYTLAETNSEYYEEYVYIQHIPQTT